MDISQEDLLKLVSDAAKTGAAEAVRAVNTPDPDARPGGGKSAKIDTPAIQIKRNQTLSIGRAIRGALYGWKAEKAEMERDFSDATRSVVGAGDETPGLKNLLTWPTSWEVYHEVLEKAAMRDVETDFQKMAVRAISEGTPTTSASGGGVLTPIAFLQDQFVTALTSPVAVLAAPGTDIIPITTPVVSLPRESTAAATAVAAEAATLSATDPTFSQQTFAAKKLYGYAQFSNELLADANPALMSFISRTLGRNVGLLKDSQFLTGSGSGANLQGIAGYSGLSTYNTATNGQAPDYKGLIAMIWALRRANVEPTAWIMHPAAAQALALTLDAAGRPLFLDGSLYQLGGASVPIASNGAGFQSANYGLQVARGSLLGYPVFFSNQLSITQTQGTSGTTCTTIYLGNFNYCRILERQAVDIAVSEHINFTTDQTAVRAIWRGALALTQPAAFLASAGFIVQ